jgi:hypothetical protein
MEPAPAIPAGNSGSETMSIWDWLFGGGKASAGSRG